MATGFPIFAGLKDVKIERLTIALANTEQSFTFPDNTRAFILRNEGSKILKWSMVATESGTKFRSLYPSESLEKENLLLNSKTLYFQSPGIGVVLEIEYWS